jgi:CIC family chloride channel protein
MAALKRAARNPGSFNRRRIVRLVLLSLLLALVGAVAARAFFFLLRTVVAFAVARVPGTEGGWLTVASAQKITHPPAWGPVFWILPLVTALGGLLVGVLTRWLAPEASGDGTDRVLEVFHETSRAETRASARVPLVKMIASAITIGTGGAAAREGPISQISAGLAAVVSERLGLGEAERRILLLVGMAAGLSAMFKSPLGAAFFAVEVPFATLALQIDVLPYALLAATGSYLLMGWWMGFAPLLPAAAVGWNARELPAVLVIALLSGLLAAFIPSVFYRIRDVSKGLPIPSVLKPALGGLIVGALGLLLPQVLTGGYGEMELGLRGGLGLGVGVAFLLAGGKIVANALTVGSGGSGGTTAEMFFVGIFWGLGLAGLCPLVGLGPVPLALGALVGMASVCAGAVRVPFAALFFTLEISGDFRLLFPLTVAVFLAFFVQSALADRFRYAYLNGAQLRAHPERLLP